MKRTNPVKIYPKIGTHDLEMSFVRFVHTVTLPKSNRKRI